MISINEILKLPVSERLLLLEKIWRSIPSDNLSLSNAQENELDRRLERLQKNETKFLTWDEVKKSLHKK
ncbi:MAG TPA: addiction module protein [Bacteroidia bacterium]|nr:MAG: hypothetical protein A3K10_00295 [Bacteroidetes bacterium RIFCSPLOWO2_12_FULL_31_6]HLC82452.1 addiction module protein [Bacteroidia bacterium]